MYKVLFVLLLVACTPGHFEANCPGLDDPKLQQYVPADRHAILAQKHEELYKEYIDKVIYHQSSLKDYEDHSQYYGRNGLDFEGHTRANIKYYEELAEKADKRVRYHRHMSKILSKSK